MLFSTYFIIDMKTRSNLLRLDAWWLTSGFIYLLFVFHLTKFCLHIWEWASKISVNKYGSNADLTYRTPIGSESCFNWHLFKENICKWLDFPVFFFTDLNENRWAKSFFFAHSLQNEYLLYYVVAWSTHESLSISNDFNFRFIAALTYNRQHSCN